MSDGNGRSSPIFPEGTIGRSMFEDMWIRHEGMPDLAELVDAAESATEEQKTKGDWDDQLWDPEKLRKLRHVSALTPRQKVLVDIGEHVVGILKLMSTLEEANPDEFMPDAAQLFPADSPFVTTPPSEFAAPEDLADKRLAAVKLIHNVVFERHLLQRGSAPRFAFDKSYLLEDDIVIPEPETYVSETGLREALEITSGGTFVSQFRSYCYGKAWPEEQIEWLLLDYYYRLRVACGADDPQRQAWRFFTTNEPLRERFESLASRADDVFEAGREFAEKLFEQLSGDIVASMDRMGPWNFTQAIAGSMIRKGDPAAAHARTYAAYVHAMTIHGGRRRRLREESAAFDAEAEAARRSPPDTQNSVLDEDDSVVVDDDLSAHHKLVEQRVKEGHPFYDPKNFVTASIEVANTTVPDRQAMPYPWALVFVEYVRQNIRHWPPALAAQVVREIGERLSSDPVFEWIHVKMREDFRAAAELMELTPNLAADLR